MDRRTLGMGIGALRTAIGAALIVAPGVAGRVWVGPGGSGPGERVFARAVGARDVALGVATLQAARDGRETMHWLRLGVVADAADAAATVLADRQLVTWRRVVMPIVAGGVALLGVALLRKAGELPRDEHAAPTLTGADLDLRDGTAGAAPVAVPSVEMAPPMGDPRPLP